MLKRENFHEVERQYLSHGGKKERKKERKKEKNKNKNKNNPNRSRIITSRKLLISSWRSKVQTQWQFMAVPAKVLDLLFRNAIAGNPTWKTWFEIPSVEHAAPYSIGRVSVAHAAAILPW
jgi:hypothetical protein